MKTVNKTVRVRNTRGFVFENLPVETTPIGYVVRYEFGGVDGGISEPLDVEENDDNYATGVLTINTGEPGTIFPTFGSAQRAVITSIEYQKSHKLNWNRMYGDYLIDSVVAQ